MCSDIRENPQVQDVFFEVNEVPEEDEKDMWVTIIYAIICTSASIDEVSKWFQPYELRNLWENQMRVNENVLTEILDEQFDWYEARVHLPYSVKLHESELRVVYIDLRDMSMKND